MYAYVKKKKKQNFGRELTSGEGQERMEWMEKGRPGASEEPIMSCEAG